MSDILRLIAGGLLALICCYIGVLIKRRYMDREKFYRDAADFVSFLSSELSFKKTPIVTALKNFAAGRKGAFIKFLDDFSVSLKRGDGFEKMCAEIDIPPLKKEEKKSLLSFFSELGRTSLDDQLSAISRAATEFGAKQKKCLDESKKLGGMYFKLLVLFGIALIIILA